jgi:hypothetical protein
VRFERWTDDKPRLWVLAFGQRRCEDLARRYGNHFRKMLIANMDTWLNGYRYSRLDKVVICADDPDWRMKRDTLIGMCDFPPDAFLMATWA